MVNGIANGNETLESFSTSLQMSQVLLLVAVASRIPPIQRVFCMFSTSILLNPVMIASLCNLPLISLIMGGGMVLAKKTQVKLPVLSTTLLALSTLTLCGLYYRNRSHKHGNLILQKEQRGMMVVTSLALAWTAQYASQTEQNVFLPILVGSSMMTLLSLTFASVADAWDAVGSGQFQMISLDTAAMIIYVVAPMLVLAAIACQKYGDSVIDSVSEVFQSQFSNDFVQRQTPETAMISGLFLLLSLSTTVGVSVVNMLSPISAHLFSKAYTHGQPRTKKVALCLHFKDLLSESDIQTNATMDFLVTANKAIHKPVLNIFVSANELRLYPDWIVKLHSAGHYFGICCTSVKEMINAYELYVKVLKVTPEWYHVGTAATSRSPDVLKVATELGVKVAFWSTHIGITSREILRKEQIPTLCQDLAATRGGSFVYLTNDWQHSDSLTAAIESIVKQVSVDSSGIQYSFSEMSNVARDDIPMTL
jgi:hypothetical protein